MAEIDTVEYARNEESTKVKSDLFILEPKNVVNAFEFAPRNVVGHFYHMQNDVPLPKQVHVRRLGGRVA
jgi:hypothetical protein